jgi:subfamily B ATP-binding cassette protein MsbA
MTSTPDQPWQPESDEPLWRLLGRIWRDYLRRRWPLLAGAAACSVFFAALSGLLTFMLKPAVDQLFHGKDPTVLLTIPLAIVAIVLLRAIFQIGQAMLVNRAGHSVVSDMQVQLFGKLVRADLARLRSAHTGSYVSSVLYDANLIRQAFTDGLITYFREALIVVAQLGVMFVVDPLLASVALVGAPLAVLVMRRYAKRTGKATRGAMAETSNLSTAVMESLDGVKIVKIENREADEEMRVRAVVDRRQRHVIRGANAKAFATPTTEAVTMTIVAGVLAVAGWRARAAGMTVGGFTVFMASMLTANQSLRQVANLQSVFSEGFAAARRLFAALDVEPEIRQAARPQAISDGSCEVRFEKVSFAYHDGAPALSQVSLTARPGETIALVGPSGGGKSTILNLIPRFYDPVAGRVTLNGLDSRETDLAQLRDKIALVTQEPFLFDDTIRANIAYSRPGASEAEIVAAAQAAAAHEFIETLPNGYDTSVGEAGARLSGGQRQRIAIARAFLKDAPILLLDEATSALDTESELKVQAALERLMQGRTTLLIAHRLSTVRGADRIYVIEAGRVVEEGSHAALIAHGGLYARLARSQNLDEPTGASSGASSGANPGPVLKALP